MLRYGQCPIAEADGSKQLHVLAWCQSSLDREPNRLSDQEFIRARNPRKAASGVKRSLSMEYLSDMHVLLGASFAWNCDTVVCSIAGT